ncbi:hypothetical protein L1887_38369 [Cichorium endivia]|nr:hypothetical protein L1887_38369 [Cichorium endivia]
MDLWRRKTATTEFRDIDKITYFCVAGFLCGTMETIQYKGVVDEKSFEEKLEGTKCRDVVLNINLAKHQRKPPKVPNTFPHRQNKNNVAPTSFFIWVISPFNDISNTRDSLIGKVGVLMSQPKWINEEVTIMEDRKAFTVGVVEYTYDWSPFHHAPFDKVEDESDENDDTGDEVSEEDGVSNT